MSNINIKPFYSKGYENANLELIKVTTSEQGQKLVSARELHSVLEIGRDFTTWIKKMIEYGFRENTDYVLLTQTGEQKGRGGHNKVDYILTLEMAKHIAMVQRTEIGMRVRNYFIECEKVAHNPYAHLSKEFQAIIMHDEKIMKLERRVEQMEENAPLAPSEYSLVSKCVSRRVYEVNKVLRLNLDKKQIGKLFKALNSDILEITGIKTRTQLRQKHLDMVLDFIKDWQPSQAVMFKINQMSLEI